MKVIQTIGETVIEIEGTVEDVIAYEKFLNECKDSVSIDPLKITIPVYGNDEMLNILKSTRVESIENQSSVTSNNYEDFIKMKNALTNFSEEMKRAFIPFQKSCKLLIENENFKNLVKKIEKENEEKETEKTLERLKKQIDIE